MNEQEKKLLIDDLCARLRYGVKARYYDPEGERDEVDVIEGVDFSMTEPEFLISQYGLRITEIKPYLRPMSSITESEMEELRELCDGIVWRKDILRDKVLNIYYKHDALDWLLKNHFDTRGLIEKGVALEALEGMYN